MCVMPLRRDVWSWSRLPFLMSQSPLALTGILCRGLHISADKGSYREERKSGAIQNLILFPKHSQSMSKGPAMPETARRRSLAPPAPGLPWCPCLLTPRQAQAKMSAAAGGLPDLVRERCAPFPACCPLLGAGGGDGEEPSTAMCHQCVATDCQAVGIC